MLATTYPPPVISGRIAILPHRSKELELIQILSSSSPWLIRTSCLSRLTFRALKSTGLKGSYKTLGCLLKRSYQALETNMVELVISAYA